MTPGSRLRADIQALLEKVEFERETRHKLAAEIADHARIEVPGEPIRDLTSTGGDRGSRLGLGRSGSGRSPGGAG